PYNCEQLVHGVTLGSGCRCVRSFWVNPESLFIEPIVYLLYILAECRNFYIVHPGKCSFVCYKWPDIGLEETGEPFKLKTCMTGDASCAYAVKCKRASVLGCL